MAASIRAKSEIKLDNGITITMNKGVGVVSALIDIIHFSGSMSQEEKNLVREQLDKTKIKETQR